MNEPQVYRDAHDAVAKLIAEERGEVIAIRHYNEATKLLWPVLSVETQSMLVMR